ncbi:hypothetical protein QWZ08_18090 [Ferruginibacter paludis]|nr:hypothetical protein [Ferruginibacter paludis]MDN3657568.1 hypothetical protein [Ferruginibacter paludis]
MKKIYEKIYSSSKKELGIKAYGMLITTLSAAYLVAYIFLVH